MSEREPTPLPCDIDPDPWDIQGVARVLQAEAIPEQHERYGRGYRFLLGREGTAGCSRLKLYPESLVARYRGATIALDLTHVEEIGTSHGAVRIVARTGVAHAVFFLLPHDPLGLRLILTGQMDDRQPTRPTRPRQGAISQPTHRDPLPERSRDD